MNDSLKRMLEHRRKLWWLRALNSGGALLSAVWLLWVVYGAGGFWRMMLAALLLSFTLRAGPALLFAVASSFLCFYYSAVGIWLPILAYCSAGAALVLDVRAARLVDRAEDEDAVIIDGKLEDWEKFSSTVWAEQLAGIVNSLGMHSPDIDIRIYPENTLDHTARPLFAVRPDDWAATASRLRDEFGGGGFNVIVFVRGEIRRRFRINVPQGDKQ